MNTLPVNEVFETIQGEAHFTGMPSVFVRLQGCPVGCVWCDTKHTWDVDPEFKVWRGVMLRKEEDSKQYSDMTVGEIMEVLSCFTAGHIVITGGEPCIHDLTELTTAVLESGRTCQIETSGTYPIRAVDGTFVTVSPKLDMAGGRTVLPEALDRATEIKYPVGKMTDIEKLEREIIPLIDPTLDVWLQPLSQSEKATALCVEQAIKRGYRVSIQTHKFMGVR